MTKISYAMFLVYSNGIEEKVSAQIVSCQRNFSNFLGKHYSKGSNADYLICSCNVNEVRYSIAHLKEPNNTYYVTPSHKFSLFLHDPACERYNVTEKLTSGGRSIIIQKDGRYHIALSIKDGTKIGNLEMRNCDTQQKSNSIVRENTSGLLTLLRLMWHVASLDVWKPTSSNLRSYEKIVSQLYGATNNIICNSRPLNSNTHIVKKGDICGPSSLNLFKNVALTLDYVFLLGLLCDDIQRVDARVKFKLYGSGCEIFVKSELWDAARKSYFDNAEDTDMVGMPYILIIRAILVKEAKVPYYFALDLAALQITDSTSWLPCDSEIERKVIKALVTENRAFKKPLPVDFSYARFIPDIDFHDTLVMPCWGEVGGMPDEEYLKQKEKKRAFCVKEGILLWEYDSLEGLRPPFPPKIS